MYRVCALIVCVSIAAAGLPLGAQTAADVTAYRGDSLIVRHIADARALIRGNALSSTGAPLVGAVVRLRDARQGRILDTQVTDEAGIFEFAAVDPGTYVVELLGADRRVLAASNLLNVQAGETASTVVKLPWDLKPAAGLFGRGIASAIAVASAAAASGVLARAVTGTPVSGEK